jgi:hypothetical protein
MGFQPTPLNVTTLLIIALGVLAGYMLSKRNYASNVPLFFYLVVLGYNNYTDRSVNETVYGAGLILAMLLRFEFMNPPLMKFVMVLEIGALALINVLYLNQIFIL